MSGRFSLTDWFRRVFSLGLNDPKSWNPSLWNLIGSQSASGEIVTEQTALTYSAVFCAVKLISETVATLPLHLSRKDRRKTIKATDRKLYHVLHSAANPMMTAMTFREVIAAHLLLYGNCYAEIIRDGFGDVTALWPIPPNRIRMITADDGSIVYQVRVDNGPDLIFPRSKILHVPGLGFDGFQGYSVIALARKSIGLSMAMETFGSLYFGHGTHPGVIVKHPGQLSKVAHDNLSTSLTAAHSGLGQAHRLLLLEEGMSVEKVSIAPEESQFLESRQFQIPEIARWFNLPPHKLKDLSRSSFSNIESEQISFVTDSILPWLIRFEQNFSSQLLTDADRRQGLYFRHNVDGLLRGDSKSRGEYYRSMFQNGFMTINEVREKEDFDPSDQEFADDLFVPVNLVPLSMLKEQMEKNETKQLPPGTGGATETDDDEEDDTESTDGTGGES